MDVDFVSVLPGFRDKALGLGVHILINLLLEVDKVLLLGGILDHIVELGDGREDQFVSVILDAFELRPTVVEAWVVCFGVGPGDLRPPVAVKRGNEAFPLDSGLAQEFQPSRRLSAGRPQGNYTRGDEMPWNLENGVTKIRGTWMAAW